MEFKQSRFQDVFSRAYEDICYGLWCGCVGLLLYFIFPEINLLSIFIFPIIISLCTIFYAIFKSKEGSKSIAFSEHDFNYVNGDEVTHFTWQDFHGVKITKLPPHRIVIANKVFGKTVFSYYAFSSEQRKSILEYLSNK